MRTALIPILFALLVPGLLPAAGEEPARPAEPEWSAAKTDALVKLAEEYARQKTFTARDAILEKARKIGPIPARAMKKLRKALFKVARSGPRSDGKPTCFAKFEPFPGKYYLTGSGGGKKGIFIGLHGGEGGIGDGRSAQSLWGAATGKGLIGVFPTANLPDHPPTTWQNAEVEQFVLEVIKELKRTFRIDTNRIYLAGHSLGGSGAYHIGPRNADLFAAISANAGGCHGTPGPRGEQQLPGGYMGNLYNTPIFITHFEGDPRVVSADAIAAGKELDALRKEFPDGFEHVFVLGKGVSHGFPPGGNPSKIIAWMTKRKRNPYPPMVIWEPTVSTKRRFFWLRKKVVFNSVGRETRIVARIAKNEITIRAHNRRGLSVMLADEMFDPKRPVVVRFGKEEVFSGYVQCDPAALLESIMESIDPAQVFTYRIDL